MAEEVARKELKRPSRWKLGHHRIDHYGAVTVFILLQASIYVAAFGVIAGVGPAVNLPWPARAAVVVAAAAGAVLFLYGRFIEPLRLTLREFTLNSRKIGPEAVRLLHLSDLHVARWGSLEDSLIAEVRRLRPDLILMTGDYTAYTPVVEDARRLLRELAAVAPSYAVLGNNDYGSNPYYWELWEDTGVVGLLNETVELEVRGTRLRLTGIIPGDEDAVMRLGAADSETYAVCLYHYPDLISELKDLPYDLMLCGHSHGGQVRLPFVGALISACRADRRYARGLFRDGGRTAFVTQGVGCESHGIARVRFLTPPEAVLITLSGVRASPNNT